MFWSILAPLIFFSPSRLRSVRNRRSDIQQTDARDTSAFFLYCIPIFFLQSAASPPAQLTNARRQSGENYARLKRARARQLLKLRDLLSFVKKSRWSLTRESALLCEWPHARQRHQSGIEGIELEFFLLLPHEDRRKVRWRKSSSKRGTQCTRRIRLSFGFAPFTRHPPTQL